jgi:stage II sporulation protein AB (anti-sigma F factor)
MNVRNYFKLEIMSLPENVSFARACVGAFASQLGCTLEEIDEIKLVVSEAVSNSIIHAYENRGTELITIVVSLLDGRTLEIIVEDYGKGIEDVARVLQPSYSSEPSRMGLGFSFMKSFMDELEVISRPGEGTSVQMRRSFVSKDNEAYA